MQKIIVEADSIINSLGFSSDEVLQEIERGNVGIKIFNNVLPVDQGFCLSMVNQSAFEEKYPVISKNINYTRFEKLVIASIEDTIRNTSIDIKSPETLIIISTTKGNIDLLESDKGFDKSRVMLYNSAKVISEYFGNPNEPKVVSNACISGSVAIIWAKELLEAGKYKHIVVSGGDLVSRFIVSGFHSFAALSPTFAKPFDSDRVGLNLGEGAATVLLSIKDEQSIEKDRIAIYNGVTANDANHISGPSRTGEGLVRAIQRTVKDVDLSEIAFVNAHGTATLYNDDMEAIAFRRTGLNETFINSYKGYFGHTLGAAGLMETILSARALQKRIVHQSIGFEKSSLDFPLNVTKKIEHANGRFALKTTSGFGSCNAALLLERVGGNK